MKKSSWKTTLFGVISGGAAIAALFVTDPRMKEGLAVAAATATTLMGASARDNNKSSEQVGLKVDNKIVPEKFK